MQKVGFVLTMPFFLRGKFTDVKVECPPNPDGPVQQFYVDWVFLAGASTYFKELSKTSLRKLVMYNIRCFLILLQGFSACVIRTCVLLDTEQPSLPLSYGELNGEVRENIPSDLSFKTFSIINYAFFIPHSNVLGFNSSGAWVVIFFVLTYTIRVRFPQEFHMLLVLLV